MKENKLVIVGLVISVLFWFIVWFFDVDLFESILELLEQLEHLEIDELILPLFIFFNFVLIDQVLKQRTYKVEAEKTKIYDAMLHSTHHIINNFLNQMQLFKLAAESVDGFPEDVLQEYDKIIEGAEEQVKALGNVSNITEKSIIRSVLPKATD